MTGHESESNFLDQLLREGSGGLPLNFPPASIRSEAIVGELTITQIDMDALTAEIKKRLGL